VIEIERSIRVIDSHTGGEPTRTVIEGGPELGSGSLAQRWDIFRERFDTFRSTVVNEPRGSDVVVGALLCKPSDPSCEAGIIFFNNVGYLGMCGHGTIGVVVTLAHLKRIKPGVCKLETPVGIISATLGEDGLVSVRNVPSYRFRKDVTVDVEGVGAFTGDVAWAGNWFFLCGKHRETLRLNNVERLTDVTWRIRNALNRSGVTGKDGAEIDHIELFSAPESGVNHSRNFVLCPGKAYDRSPCGTGTSAKIACLAADGKLKAGEIWRQESIIGSVFEGFYETEGDLIIPTIRGSAYITGDCTLLLQKNDPLQQGIRQ
jgi:4-hydroxyproline epimerase